MRIVIAGGTGFLGPAARRTRWPRDGHDIVVLVAARGTRVGGGALVDVRVVPWTPDGHRTVGRRDRRRGAVVNLAGESIAASAGPPRRRRESSTAACSRRAASSGRSTGPLSRQRCSSAAPPSATTARSATKSSTEDTPPGSDFLARRLPAWEAEAMRARAAHRRRRASAPAWCSARDGGALPQMLPPFWFGAGGPVGSGRQYWPWIHRADWVGLVRWAISHARRERPDQRERRRAGDQRRVRASARPRDASSVVHAGAGVCAEACCSARWRRRCSCPASVRFPQGRTTRVYVPVQTTLEHGAERIFSGSRG